MYSQAVERCCFQLPDLLAQAICTQPQQQFTRASATQPASPIPSSTSQLRGSQTAHPTHDSFDYPSPESPGSPQTHFPEGNVPHAGTGAENDDEAEDDEDVSWFFSDRLDTADFSSQFAAWQPVAITGPPTQAAASPTSLQPTPQATAPQPLSSAQGCGGGGQPMGTALAVMLCHGQPACMRLAAAALAMACGANHASTVPAAAAAAVEWRRHVHVHALLGPGSESSVVLPGVCLPLSGDAHRQACAARLLEGRDPPLPKDHQPSSSSTAPAAVVVTAAFLEGSLGLLAPSRLHAAGDVCEHNRHSATAAVPPWIDMLPSIAHQVSHVIKPQTESAIQSGLRSGSAGCPCEGGGAVSGQDAQLSAAVEAVLKLLQPYGVQLVCMGGWVPDVLIDALHEQARMVVLRSLPAGTLRAVADACGGCQPAAGLSGLSHASVATVSVRLIEAGYAAAPGSGSVVGQRGAGGRGTTSWQGHTPLQSWLHITHADDVPDHAKGSSALALTLAAAGCPIPRPVSILLTATTQPALQAAEAQLPSCFARLRACLAGGRVLAGGGVFELACAHALCAHADRTLTQLAQLSGVEWSGKNTQGLPLPAWQRLNSAVREERAGWEAQVLLAFAECMEDMVGILLRNQGQTSSNSSSQVWDAIAAAKAALACVATDAVGDCHTPPAPSRLDVARVLSTQRALHGGADDDDVSLSGDSSLGAVMVADDVGCRVYALHAVLAAARQLLSVQHHLVNH